jgi:hypothetical protein
VITELDRSPKDLDAEEVVSRDFVIILRHA